MSTNRSRMAVIGPIIGFLLIYVIIRYGVNGFQADMKLLGDFGAVTLQEVQSTGVDEIEEAVAEEAAVEAAADDAVTEVEVEAAAAEAEAVEQTTAEDESVEDAAASETPALENGGQGRRGQGIGAGGNGGMGSELQARHMAPIPDEYVGLTSSVAANADSLARGKVHFDQLCASCHGNQGLGDGPAAAALDPVPPMIAQTSLMTGDDYLFWRISEGGALEPFNSAMPSWKGVLDEQARWDTINYVRSLGGMQPGADAGTMRQEMQATMQAEMLASALDLGVIDTDEADTFSDIHERIDAYRLSLGDAFSGNIDDMQDELLAGMVDAGQLTQAEADAFVDIRARLDEAGIMQ